MLNDYIMQSIAVEYNNTTAPVAALLMSFNTGIYPVAGHTSLIPFSPLYVGTGSSVQFMEGTGLYPTIIC